MSRWRWSRKRSAVSPRSALSAPLRGPDGFACCVPWLQIFLECSKRNVSAGDFNLSVMDLKFTEQQRAVLGEVRACVSLSALSCFRCCPVLQIGRRVFDVD